MKPILNITLLAICLQVALIFPATAQKIIQIATQLKENSEPMTAKRKGFSGVGKWEFGPYKMIESESGWTRSKTKAPLFGDYSSTHSTLKKSYIMVNESDTCVANIQVLENIETSDGGFILHDLLKWSESEVNKGEGVFETVFELSTDTIRWRLAVVYPLMVETESGDYNRDNKTIFKGVLTDNETIIDIREVEVSEDGKTSMFYPLKGYEFWLGTESVAAVQVSPVNKFYVWIRSDLHDSFKFLLANAAAAMLVKTY